MSNQYVQIRFQTSSTATQNTNHDFRKSKVSYLRNDAFHNQFENVFYVEDDDNVVKQNINTSYKEYNELYKKKNKRNLQKGKQSDLLTGIITLSPIINEWLEHEVVTPVQLNEAFARALESVINNMTAHFKEQMNIHYAVIHYDEKTPHMHFALANHTQDAKPIFYELKRSGTLHKYQDLVASAFEYMKIDLKRGKRKSTARHMSVREMHETEAKNRAKEIVSNAEEHAENVLIEAENRAEEIVSDAENKAIEITDNIYNTRHEIEFLKIEITTHQGEIKQLQEEKREIKQNIEYSVNKKHEELTKLDAEIRVLRAKKRADEDDYNTTLQELSKRLADISSAVDAHEERYDSLAVKQLRAESESINKIINTQRKTRKVKMPSQ